HAALGFGSNFSKFSLEAARSIKELLRTITLHPLLQNFDVFGFLLHLAHRHLVGAPRVFRPFVINFLRTSPTLRRTQDDHRPAGAIECSLISGSTLNTLDFANSVIERGGHELVHFLRLTAFYEDRVITIATEKLIKFLVTD